MAKNEKEEQKSNESGDKVEGSLDLGSDIVEGVIDGSDFIAGVGDVIGDIVGAILS